MIFGGTKGIGLVIKRHLDLRGDNIINFSRTIKENKKNIKIDLSNELSINNSLKKINYIKRITILFLVKDIEEKIGRKIFKFQFLVLIKL